MADPFPPEGIHLGSCIAVLYPELCIHGNSRASRELRYQDRFLPLRSWVDDSDRLFSGYTQSVSTFEDEALK